ncbi:calmodulin [Kitasatospora sp. NPDC059827]|uniref:BP74-related protein n=1 Tax=Kitasatospora sp. NPDC059827 TaxID=3346964 RepID=UPI003662EA34
MAPALFGLQPSPNEDEFVFRLDDEERIRQARAILAGTETTEVHVQGRVVAETADHNPEWNFHLEPASITFFATADDDCDATGHYVATQLDSIGEEGFLPDKIWAPARSRITREIGA